MTSAATLPSAAIAAALLEPVEPRSPTAHEVEALDLLTLARLVYRWQAAAEEPIVVSVRTLIEHVRSLGFTPGRIERYTAGLAELELLGILERTSDGPQSPRRLRAIAFDDAAAIVAAG